MPLAFSGHFRYPIQFGSKTPYVRPVWQTECNGMTFALGRLRNFDLAFFNGAMPRSVETDARARSERIGLIVYRFFHWRRRDRIEHGWLITTEDHRFLSDYVTGPTTKSRDVVAKARDVILTGT